jgi:uncharacterized YigZ family protein
MLFEDTYRTIKTPGQGEYKDKGSRFIGYTFRVHDEDQCKIIIQQIKKEHHQAAHHCFAYVLGFGGEIQKFNDDREPANTAGRPILRAVLSQKLTQTLVVVVRYFGGKLLGVPGLIQAYEGAAIAALQNSQTEEVILQEVFEITTSYEHENDLFRLIKQFGLRVLAHHHAENVSLRVSVRKSAADEFLQTIRLNHHLNVKFMNEV